MARRLLVVLLASGLVLLILCVALLAAGRLLAALGDEGAASVVDRCGLVTAVVAGVNLIVLVYVLGYLMVRIWEEPEDLGQEAGGSRQASGGRRQVAD
jgi:hypothetical protein